MSEAPPYREVVVLRMVDAQLAVLAFPEGRHAATEGNTAPSRERTSSPGALSRPGVLPPGRDCERPRDPPAAEAGSYSRRIDFCMTQR